MSELGEEMRQDQDHGISGSGDNGRNVRQRLSLPEATHLLPLDSTIAGFAMLRWTWYITVLTLMNKNHKEISRKTRIDMILVSIISNANTGTGCLGTQTQKRQKNERKKVTAGKYVF